MIETERLLLRRWTARDRAPFAALNGDAAVMRHMLRALTPLESDAMILRFEDRWQSDGVGFAVAERSADAAFVGMVGLSRLRLPELGPPIDGALEVGWRLAPAYWGRGYATEAARAWLGYGFDRLGMDEIVAITSAANLPSQAVMRRLGMRPDPARSFEHPALPPGDPLSPHLLFAIGRDAWPG
jgi:RimJ/RimL family protein N-acetyltransferase